MFKYYTLKKYVWLLILTVFIGNFCFAQINGGYPNTHSQSNTNTLENFNGGVSSQSFQFRRNFADTTSANATSLKDAPFIEINVNDSIFKRNATATRWVNLSTIGSSVVPSCQGLIFGGVVTLNSGMDLNVTNAQYCINGTTYNSLSTIVTLSAADPSLPRKDVIVANTSGSVVVLTGTSATNPIQPQIDPQTQIFLAAVDIPAGATTPANITRIIIYDENVGPTTEWTATSLLSTGGVSFDNTTLPYHGTIDADCSSGIEGILLFTKFDTINIQSNDVLQLFIKLKSAFPSTSSIKVAFTLGGALATNYITLDNTNGFLYNSTSAYQNISIPVPLFQPVVTQTDGLQILITGTNSGFYLDYIQLQSGIAPPLPSYDNRYWKNRIRDTSFVVQHQLDSFYLKHIPTLGDSLAAFPSPVTIYSTTVRDTVNNLNLPAEFYIGVEGSRGTASPKYDLYIKNKNGIKNIVMNQDGSNSMWNTLLFDKESSAARIFSANPIFIRGQAISDQFKIINGAGALLSGDHVKIESGSQWIYGQSANTFDITGASGANLFQIKQRGIGAMNAPTNENLTMDFQGVGQGVRFDTMTTTQLSGVGWMIDQVTLTNGGSGYSALPTFTATSNTGGRPAVIVPAANLLTGVITGLNLGFHGNGYTSGGSLTVNNTGTGGSGAAGTYTVKFIPIPRGTIIYNIDSLKYYQYNGTSWECMCGTSGGGGSVGTLQQVTDLGNSTTNSITITKTAGTIGIAGSSTRTLISIDGSSGENAGVYTDETGTSAHLQVHANSASEGFLSALQTKTILTLNAPNDEALTTFEQNADSTFINVVSPNGNAKLVWPSITDMGSSSWRYLLPQKSGTVAMLSDITGGGINNTNIGSAFRWLNPGTQELRTAAAGYGLTVDSSSTSNALTYKLDSSTVYTYVRSLITGGTSGSLTFNTDQFTIDSLGGNPDSLQATIKNTSYANMLAFFGPDGKLIANDSLKWSLGSLNIKGNASIGGESSHGLLINDLLSVIGDFYGNDGGTMVRVNGEVYTVGIGDVDDNNNGTVQTLDDDAQTITLTAANGIIISTVPEYADNAAAISAGLVVGTIYRTGDDLKIVH